MTKLMPDGSISVTNEINSAPPAWLGLAFRPFFLLGALFSVISLLLWGSILSGYTEVSPFGGVIWWHTHEMLFGFVAAIIVGFLLTAVKTWTGQPGFGGYKLLLLVLLWLAARVSILMPNVIPAWLISTLDLLFLPTAAVLLAIPIIKVKLWRNLAFVPLLAMMSYTNGMMHCSVFINSPEHLYLGANSMVLIISFVMCMMAGRVFPMFTANGTKTERVNALPWLEKLSLASLLIIVLTTSFTIPVAKSILVTLYLVSASLLLFRGLRWRIGITLKTPLVWSLHVSYLCIPLGLGLIGLAEVAFPITRSLGVHVITVGAMGLMILAMIARVSLGHTGRAIIASKAITIAFLLMLVALLSRVIGPFIISNYNSALLVSILFWCAAYFIFVVKYFSILTSPRVDGKAG